MYMVTISLHSWLYGHGCVMLRDYVDEVLDDDVVDGPMMNGHTMVSSWISNDSIAFTNLSKNDEVLKQADAAPDPLYHAFLLLHGSHRRTELTTGNPA